MEIKRRRMLTEPGDALVMSSSSLESMDRFTQWQELTGMAPSGFTADTMCSVPIPIYAPILPGERRFENVLPQALWHPLFWLPTRVAGEYRIKTGPDGELEGESVALRSARIALEMTASGLYDPETGAWIDIMSTVGIDVDSPTDIERITQWQSGGVDDTLDAIDLDQYLQVAERPNWAMESAMAMLPTMERALWAVLADSLIELIDSAVFPDKGEVNLPDLREATSVAAFLASVHLEDVPVDSPEGASGFWTAIEQRAKEGTFSGTTHFIADVVEDAKGWLYLARDTHWASLDELRTLEDAS